jgi:hypothetical protein
MNSTALRRIRAFHQFHDFLILRVFQRRDVLEFLYYGTLVTVDQLPEARQVMLLQGARELHRDNQVVEAGVLFRVAILAGVVPGIAELLAKLYWATYGSPQTRARPTKIPSAVWAAM